MIEVGVVIDTHGEPVFWHLPPGRTSVAIPDTRELWDVLWAYHQSGTLAGFAHSHPGFGIPGPSYTDVTTFAAIESGLGRRLTWWITSADYLVALVWKGPDRLQYQTTLVTEAPAWLVDLRRLSQDTP